VKHQKDHSNDGEKRQPVEQIEEEELEARAHSGKIHGNAATAGASVLKNDGVMSTPREPLYLRPCDSSAHACTHTDGLRELATERAPHGGRR
jgi:hypothetical protein